MRGHLCVLNPTLHYDLCQAYCIRVLGTCQSGTCVLPTQCGNGVLQGDEECECGWGTSCKFCFNCRLAIGKECTPDSATPCCDDQGKFLTTTDRCTKLPEGIDGYCNRGVCASLTSECKIDLTITSGDFFSQQQRTIKLDKFCGVSAINSCKAKCGSRALFEICEDTAVFSSGGKNLEDGAVCMEGGLRGECTSGSCQVNVKCGDKVLEGSEECECASGNTKCRYWFCKTHDFGVSRFPSRGLG